MRVLRGLFWGGNKLVPEMKEENVEVEFTTMARTSYQRLFKSTTKAPADNGGPAAIPESEDGEAKEDDNIFQLRDEHHAIPLSFAFAPDISSIIDPHPASLVCPSLLPLSLSSH